MAGVSQDNTFSTFNTIHFINNAGPIVVTTYDVIAHIRSLSFRFLHKAHW